MKLLNKQNLRRFLLTKILLLFFLFNANSQLNLNKSFVDSISINLDSFIGDEFFEYGYNIKLRDSLLLIFPFEKEVFFKFNINTHQIEEISFSNNHKNSYYERRYIISNKIITCDILKAEIFHFDWEGNLIRKIKLKLFWNKYQIPLFGNFIPTENNNYLLPISKRYKGFDKMQSEKELKRYYGRQGLIGVFDDRGKLIKKVGQYDSIYQDRLLKHSDKYYFTLIDKSKIILSQHLSHNLQVIDLETDSLVNLNFKGKHIEKDRGQIPTVESENYEDYNSYIIESFHYGSIRTFNKNRMIYRYYQKSYKDTTTNKNLNLPEENKKENLCVPPSQRELNQKQIIKNKELYFQLIDIDKEKVLYDDVFPFRGKYLYRFNDETIWTGKLSLEEIKLYKYNVVLE